MAPVLPPLNPGVPADVRLGFKRPPLIPTDVQLGFKRGLPTLPPSGAMAGGTPPALEEEYAQQAANALAQAAAGGGAPPAIPSEGYHSNFEHMLNQTIGQGPGNDFAPHRPVFMGRPAQARIYPQILSLSHRLAHAAVNHRRRPNHDFASGI